MSFSFNASGAPGKVIDEVRQLAATTDEIPLAFADSVIVQLGLIPDQSKVGVRIKGHTGWGRAQTKGQINLHVEIDVVAPSNPEGDQVE